MKSQTVEITNKLGLHARSSTKIVNLVNSYEKATVTLSTEAATADGSSMMDLLMLEGYFGVTVEITVESQSEEEEAEILSKLVDLFERKFDEKE